MLSHRYISCRLLHYVHSSQIDLRSHNTVLLAAMSLSPMFFMTCFWCLPLPVLGKSSATPGSPIQNMCTGVLCQAKVFLTQSCTSSFDNLSAPSAHFKKHPTTSPYFVSGRPNTLASLMDGCEASRLSTSQGEMFSPPTISVMFVRTGSTSGTHL